MSVQTSLRLSFTPTDSGEVIITDGRILGEQGREVTIDAVPRAGYRFVRWEVSTSPVDQPPPVDRCEDRTGQTAGDSYCQGGILYQPIYNSDCTVRTEELGVCGDTPELPCSTTPELLSTQCVGTTLVGTYSVLQRVPVTLPFQPIQFIETCVQYTETIRENDSSCQPIVTPTPCPPAGTVTGTSCDGTTLLEQVADGNCGIALRVREFLSTTCGYVAPTPTPTPQESGGGGTPTEERTFTEGAGGLTGGGTTDRGTEVLE
jgi:hypothetical protein